MKKILIVFLLMTGCVTAEQKEAFKNTNDKYVGKSADELIIDRGPPTSSATLSTGGKVFEYSNSNNVTSGGGSTTVSELVYVPGPNGSTGSWVNVPTQKANPVSSKKYWCKLLFTISPLGIVEKWTAEGNRCITR